MPPGGASARARAARRGCCMRAGTIAHGCAVRGRMQRRRLSVSLDSTHTAAAAARADRGAGATHGAAAARHGELADGRPRGSPDAERAAGGPQPRADRGAGRRHTAATARYFKRGWACPSPHHRGDARDGGRPPPPRRPSPAHSPRRGARRGRRIAGSPSAALPPHAPHDERRGRRRGSRRKGAALAGGRSCAGRTRIVRPLRAVPAAADW